MAGFADDDVVQHSDADDVGGLLQAGRQLPVFAAGRMISRGVVVLCDVSNYVEFLQPDAAAPASNV